VVKIKINKNIKNLYELELFSFNLKILIFFNLLSAFEDAKCILFLWYLKFSVKKFKIFKESLSNQNINFYYDTFLLVHLKKSSLSLWNIIIFFFLQLIPNPISFNSMMMNLTALLTRV